eukprot:GHVR01030277.1.p1 GENE.GHVR01030277.1~~GHVR01030277.1.p1  ORF type:complete len:109 (+),score=12.17 GHVR01030277.1:281-607(+)
MVDIEEQLLNKLRIKLQEAEELKRIESKGLLGATITSSTPTIRYDSTTRVNSYASILGFMQLIGELEAVIESRADNTSPRFVASSISEALECYWFYSSYKKTTISQIL